MRTSDQVQTLPQQAATRTVVRELTPADSARWDKFVTDTPEASFFHLSGWSRALQRTFGYEPVCRFAERDGKIVAIAPMCRVKNWIQGEVLISSPFAVYGGIVAVDEDAESILLQNLKEYAAQKNVGFLELRSRNANLYAGFHPNNLYVTFTMQLSSSDEENMKRLPRDTRYMVRKGEKKGLAGRTGLDQMDAFFELFAMNMQNHGTPMFPRSWINNLVAEFQDSVDLLGIYSGEEMVSGVLSFQFRDIILPYYAGVGPKANALAANNFMYWDLMRRSVAKGLRHFDFGRSKRGTGSYTFKSTWNMQEEPLAYQIQLVRRKTVPDFNPLNPKIQRATQLWQKLPAWAARTIGPRVVRWFP